MKDYMVTIRPLRPAWDDLGTEVRVRAKTKAKAISEARRINERRSIYTRVEGPLSYRAVEAEVTEDFYWIGAN